MLRSFRHSSSGLPLLNIDVAFSAFLGTGPALEVIAKILDKEGNSDRGGRGRGSFVGQGGRGGYYGGVQNHNGPTIVELTEREIGIIKHKLRGVKVSCQSRSVRFVPTVVLCNSSSVDSTSHCRVDHLSSRRKYHVLHPRQR